jgi:protein-L-isoaspartate(D-aspartate) O-methyltransferase
MLSGRPPTAAFAMLRRRHLGPQGAMEALVGDLKREGLVKRASVERALLGADRSLFVPPESSASAFDDAPLSIGYGQTISAPHMVAIMAEALQASPGMKVLEVGGGSGWHAAVIASLVRPGGRVVSVERVPALASLAEANLGRAGFADTVTVVVADGSVGYPEEAPFDRISVAAAAPRVPAALVAQLERDGGLLLVPVGPLSGQELIEVTTRAGEAFERSLGGCVFVPLVGAQGYSA